MTRAQELIDKFKGIDESADTADAKQNAKLTGVKDAELAKTFSLEMGQSYELAPGGQELMVPNADNVAIADVQKAFDIEITTAAGEAAGDVPPMEQLAGTLESAGATSVVMDGGRIEFIFNREKYVMSRV